LTERAHFRHFRIADIDIKMESDLAFTKNTLHPKFKHFEVNDPVKDAILIRHHFTLPDLKEKDLGDEVYRRPPWRIYKNSGYWVYLGTSPIQVDKRLHRVATFNANYTRASIYNDEKANFLKGNLHSLTMFSTDQIVLANILVDRQGCYLHSCGVNFEGKGLLFIGHSAAGKSTIAKILKDKAEVLCDDRIIVRNTRDGLKIYGTWDNGEVQDVSPNSAPLKAIMFLHKAEENLLMPLEDKKEITRRLLVYLIKPFVTIEWWQKALSIVEKIAGEVPCYELKFDKSGKVVDILGKI